jgi:hypothetical protein
MSDPVQTEIERLDREATELEQFLERYDATHAKPTGKAHEVAVVRNTVRNNRLRISTLQSQMT